ncbi:5'-nucleotidase C-terminal domain-containing protein [bacterium]|nr:5'-nucleotidase C-terminal domain-containing protein [bacterium]
MKITGNFKTSFEGTTRVYAITDSHQETRKTSAFLSRIINNEKDNKNVLFLCGGDIFKGIYPRPLERDIYLKTKKAKPDMEMITTIGNNDFGFNNVQLSFLKDTLKTFSENGIHTVCANVFKENGEHLDNVKPYVTIERDGDKSFVTGFCINNINVKKEGIVAKPQEEVLDEVIEAIKKEKPQNIIILNHDHVASSDKIMDYCKEKGISVSLLVGGHEHDFIPHKNNSKIYYPEAFSNIMYKMDLVNNGKETNIQDVEMIKNENLDVDEIFAGEIKEFEAETGLLDNIMPSVLNLTRHYEKTCPLGSFLADEMQKVADSDIAFFSTGFLSTGLPYKKDSHITNYIFNKALSAPTPVKKVELTGNELKTVFQHALNVHTYKKANPRFLQLSNNIKLEGVGDDKLQKFILKQIYINNEPLLDTEGEVKDKNRTYTCAIDSFLSEGGQGYEILAKKPSEVVLKNGEPAKINEVLLNALKEAEEKYPKGSEYPFAQVIEL